jgi:flagellar motor switch protein FliN/FliY
MKIKEAELPELKEGAMGHALFAPDLSLLKHVDVTLEVKVGEASLTVAELFALKAGSRVKLDRLIDEPVDVLLNGKVIAAGQLAVMGEHLGVRITEVRNGDTELPR